MTTEKCIRLMAGVLILTSVLLAAFVSKWWLLLAAFVGANLVQSVFTNWCLAEDILKNFGMKCCCSGEEKKESSSCCGGH